MATLYTYAEMVTDVTNFIPSYKLIDQYLGLYFEVLAISGLRITELIETSRFTFQYPSGEPQCYVSTLKGSNARDFPASFFPSLFYEKVLANANYFTHVNASTISFQFKKYFPKKPIKHGDKNLTGSFFRHYFAKKMKNEGYTDLEIKMFFGEIDQRNMDNYIYSDLYWG